MLVVTGLQYVVVEHRHAIRQCDQSSHYVQSIFLRESGSLLKNQGGGGGRSDADRLCGTAYAYNYVSEVDLRNIYGYHK